MSICTVLILILLSKSSKCSVKGDAEGGDDAENDYGSAFLWEVLVAIVTGLILMAITWALKQYAGCHCTESLEVDENPLQHKPPSPGSSAIHNIDGPTEETSKIQVL